MSTPDHRPVDPAYLKAADGRVWDPINHNWMRPQAMDSVVKVRASVLVKQLEQFLGAEK